MEDEQGTEEPRIVEAVAAMTGTGDLGQKTALSKEVEAAMSAAVLQCLEEGISMDDPDTMRERMLEARKDVIAKHNAPPPSVDAAE